VVCAHVVRGVRRKQHVVLITWRGACRPAVQVRSGFFCCGRHAGGEFGSLARAFVCHFMWSPASKQFTTWAVACDV